MTVAETKYKPFLVSYSRCPDAVNQGWVGPPGCQGLSFFLLFLHNSGLPLKSRWQLEQQSLYGIPTTGKMAPTPFKYRSCM